MSLLGVLYFAYVLPSPLAADGNVHIRFTIIATVFFILLRILKFKANAYKDQPILVSILAVIVLTILLIGQ